MKSLTKNEIDALLGLFCLKNDRMIKKQVREEGYKYKSKLQIQLLERVFQITKYPSTNTRTDLAILLEISPRSVQIWFQNTRQIKKENSGGSTDNNGSDKDSYQNITLDVNSGDLLKMYFEIKSTLRRKKMMQK